jgi:N-sulfoglucosamine sulfohydrolase
MEQSRFNQLTKRELLLKGTLFTLALVAVINCTGQKIKTERAPEKGRNENITQTPNILLITVDDMNCNSVGVFGCELKNTTPAIDLLAKEGMRFNRAHTVVANCVPSRNVLLSGRYPHSSGVEGFYPVQNDFPVLSDLLQDAGYFTAIFNKTDHSTPFHPYNWDLILDTFEGVKLPGKDPHSYYASAKRGIEASRNAGKPFFLIENISDPHVPFYGMNGKRSFVEDPYKPTRVFSPEEVPVPGFLPDHPDTRLELSHYYSSVRRADDCVGQILKALDESGERKNTLIVFLSDHGMPFPFAKTCVYHHSTRTPLILSWQGVIGAGKTDDEHMVSMVDFVPTIMDLIHREIPEGVEGRSFFPLLFGEKQDGRDFVIKEYNESAGGSRHPMRSVESKKYGYIFNPWSVDSLIFTSATRGMLSYDVMKRLSSDSEISDRYRFFNYRTVEEFYDYETDPDALNNLIADPGLQEEIQKHREILENWMVETNDHALEAFRNRYNPEVLKDYVSRKQSESNIRRKNK